jgi:uncharacterized damage-inducible protein DinB
MNELANFIESALASEVEELRDSIKKLVEPLSYEELWKKPLEPGNSVGHLILHLTGNLNHFVGYHLGKTSYVRDREREFTETNLPQKDVLLKGLDEAVALFRRVVTDLSAEQLAAPFPEARFGLTISALMHWVTHFALHRGQMSYIARMVQGTLPPR